MTRWRGAVSLAAALMVAGCQRGQDGTLEASWISLDTTLGSGDLEVPVRGTWCGSRGRLTLLGMAGDTGVGILVRTVGLAPGRFDVSDTAAARAPGSGIAFRVVRGTSLFTLSGDSGAVAITSVAEGRVAGRFLGWFTQAGAGPVALTGSFRGVTLEPDSVRCESSTPPALPVPGPDSGVS